MDIDFNFYNVIALKIGNQERYKFVTYTPETKTIN